MATEERKDDLFSINLDQEIEIIETKKDKTEKKNEPIKENEANIYDDGSFEVNEIISEESSSENEAEVIEKTEKKDKGKAPSTGGSSDSSSSSSPYLAFAKDRAGEGVFLNFTDDEWKELVEQNEGDEAQALRELHSMSLQAMVKQGVENFKESLTPEEKLLYEAKEKGLPVDKYSIAKRNAMKYKALTADQVRADEKVQIDVVSKALELKGFTPEEIAEEIEGYKALENLEAKAIKALEIVPKAFEREVKTLEDTAIAEDNAKKDKIRQRVAKMKGLVENTPEIVPGIKLNKVVREKIVESMTVPVGQDDQGNPVNAVMATRAKNPEAFEMMIHYYHQLGLFNIGDDGKLNPDFSKIAKIEKTKAVDSMRTIFESKENLNSGKAAKVNTQTDELDDFDKAFRRL